MPLDPKLNKFTTASPVIASYDYFDLAEGTGTKLFYGYATETSGGVDYSLTGNSSVYPAENYAGSISEGAGTQTFDLDLDLSVFNSNRTLKGTALVCFTLGGSSTVGWSTSAVVTIRKWDGTTETDLVTITTPALTGNNNEDTELMSVPLTIPRTPFKKGETLRLTIVATTTIGGAQSCNVILGHDPQNRDWNAITPSSDDTEISKLLFFCPFDLKE